MPHHYNISKNKTRNLIPLHKVKKLKSLFNPESILTGKINDPENTQNRVSPFNKQFYQKPYGRKK
jgi:hypothetical protein